MKHTFFKEYGFWIIFFVVFGLAFVWMGTKRTIQGNSNNVADWLPDSFNETQEYKWFIRHFPFESFIVVSWEGCTLEDPRLEMFAQKLVPGQTIDNMDLWANAAKLSAELKLDNKSVEPPVVEAETAMLAGPVPSAVENVPDDDIGKHYFKSVITGPRLVRMLKDRYSRDPGRTGSLTEDQIFERLDGVLVGPEEQEGDHPDCKHRNTALIVTLTSSAKGKELRKVVEKIKEIGRECGVEPPIPPDDRSFGQKAVDYVKLTLWEMVFKRTPSTAGVILGGPPIDNVAIDYEGERTLYRLAGICAMIGLGISWACLRSLRLTFIVFSIAIVSAGISMALVSFSGGHCDAILLSMPALVYVLTMSGAIHIINYYHDTIREHGLEGAAERAIINSWYPCSMAVLTTAFGLGSLYMSHLIPIIKFGVYTAIGVLAALVLLFLLLPAMLHFFPSRKFAEQFGGKGLESQKNDIFLRFWLWFGGIIIRNNKTVALGCIVAMIVCGVGLTKIKTSVKMMRFFSGDSEIIAHYTWLEGQLGPLVPMEVVIQFDNAECHLNTLERITFVEQVSHQIRDKLPEEVGGVMSAATVAPNLHIDGPAGSLRKQMPFYIMNGQLDRNRAQMKDYVTIEKMSFDRNAYLGKENEYHQFLEQSGITEREAKLLVAAGVPTLDLLLYNSSELTIPGLPDAELEAVRKKGDDWQQKHGHDLWRISMRVWALKRADIDYAQFIDSVKAVVEPMLLTKETDIKVKTPTAITAKYTGMVPVVYKTQHELLIGLQESLLMSFVTIAATMMFVLRSFTAGFLAMLPNVFPIVIVFGFMGIAGILVDVGTMMTASVALGIAVDNTIHFLTWFREGIERGMNAREAAMDGYERCATAMSETSLIGGLGLSAFAFSTFTPTQMFGVMMLALMFTSLAGDLIFLPAMLTGPAGRFFFKKRKKDPSLQDVPVASAEEPGGTKAAFGALPPNVEGDRYLGHCHLTEKPAPGV